MKFCGKVGFYLGCEETSQSVYTPNIVEKDYVGEKLRCSRRFRQTENQNDDLVVSERISIACDIFAKEHWSSIRYIEEDGVKLKVESIDISYPRLILEVGGVWNGTT